MRIELGTTVIRHHYNGGGYNYCAANNIIIQPGETVPVRANPFSACVRAVKY